MKQIIGANIKPHWVDLPKDKLTSVLGVKNDESIRLEEIITVYHTYAKDNLSALQNRINCLHEIITFLEQWRNNPLNPNEKLKHLVWLSEIASSKYLYLKELKNLQDIENSIGLAKHLTKLHMESENLPSQYKAITLNKCRFFSLKKKDYWGDFWWTTLDPCHRQLTNYLLVYQEQIEEKLNFSVNFFMWLETQYVPYNQPREIYMSAQEKERCLIRTQRQRLVTVHNELAHCCKEGTKYIFVIDHKEQLYITAESDLLFHSCFCGGGPVLSSGKIRIMDGTIQAVSFESGHYIPSLEVGYQLFTILFKRGYVQKVPVEIDFFHDRNKFTVVVTPENLLTFESFKEALFAGRRTCEEGHLNNGAA